MVSSAIALEATENVTTKSPPLQPVQVVAVTGGKGGVGKSNVCLLYTSPSPRDQRGSRMPSSA